MRGPHILVESLRVPSVRGKHGNVWQYHSRSDRHSKVACWSILFDLIATCPLLVRHLQAGKVGFGINHEMRDFKTGRKKDLDLVLCTPGTPTKRRKSITFASLVDAHSIVLSNQDHKKLSDYPIIERVPVGSVHLALEAKACMTAHVRALPRLYDELNSSHSAIHGASDAAIAAGFAMVNLADEFISPGLNKSDLATTSPVVTRHRQPQDAVRAVDKIREIPRRTRSGEDGFDAFGIVVVRCRNDGSPLELVSDPPAPRPNEIFHYDSMVRRIAHQYESRFSEV